MPATVLENEKKTRMATINQANGDIALIDLQDWAKFIGEGNDWGYKHIKTTLGHTLISVKIGHKTREKVVNTEPGPFNFEMKNVDRYEIAPKVVEAPAKEMENIHKKLSKKWPTHFNSSSNAEVAKLVTRNKNGTLCVWSRISVEIKTGIKEVKLALTQFGTKPVNEAFKNMTILEASNMVGGLTAGRICHLVKKEQSFKTICDHIE